MSVPITTTVPAGYLAFVATAHSRFGTVGRRLTTPNSWLARLSRKQDARRSRKPWREVLTAVVQESANHSGMVLEFGVHKAHSTNLLADLIPGSTIHGFDSFKGFPDDGRTDWQHDFALDQLPEVAANVSLHEGFFADSLPPFVAEHRQELSEHGIRLLHVDCDIYSSTVTVFEHLQPYIAPGTIIVFDELLNYGGYLHNELLAFYEFLVRSGLGFEWCVTIGKSAGPDDPRLIDPDRTMRAWRRDGYYQNHSVRIVAPKLSDR